MFCFKNKYLKYKSKYLQLKNQLGGVGFNKDGIHTNGTKFDDDGFDINGFNIAGLFRPPKCVANLDNKNNIICFAFHPTLPLLLIGSTENAKLWHFSPDGTTVSCVATMEEKDKNLVKMLEFHPTLPYLVIVDGQSIKLWHFTSEYRMTKAGTLLYHSRDIHERDVTWSDNVILDKKFHSRLPLLVAVSDNNILQLWTFLIDRTDKKNIELLDHKGCTTVAFHSTLDLLVTASNDHPVKLWNLLPSFNDGYSATCMSTLDEHKVWVDKVAFHPTGPFLVTASHDCRAKLWSFLPNGSNAICETTVWGDRNGYRYENIDEDEVYLDGRERFIDLKFHPFLNLLVTGSADNDVKLWELSYDGSKSNLTCVSTMKEHTDVVIYVTFHKILPFLITHSNDRTVKLCHFSPDGGTVNCVAINCVATLESYDNIDVHQTLPFIVSSSNTDRATLKLWRF